MEISNQKHKEIISKLEGILSKINNSNGRQGRITEYLSLLYELEKKGYYKDYKNYYNKFLQSGRKNER